MTNPLDGVRVVELGTFVVAPSCAAALADWGADVVKIEHPSAGDPARYVAAWGVPALVDDVGYIFEFSNRSKRSVTIDVAHPEGYEVFLRLIASADVFVTNLLPAARRKLRIEPDQLMAHNPRLIYGRVSGQGIRGPQAEMGGFDAMTYWARSSASMSVTPGDYPYPLAMPGPGFGDVQTGMNLAGGIGTALYLREKTGTGHVVDVSLLASGIWQMGLTLLGASLTGRDMLAQQSHFDIQNPVVNTYRTSDGFFIQLVFLQSDRYWPEFCLTVGKEDWLGDERFVDADARAANAEACILLLDELFSRYTLAEWTEILNRQRGQWDIVNTPGRVLHDADAIANGYLHRVEHDGTAVITLATAPVQFGEESATPRRAPKLGAHTEEVLTELGVSSEERARLRDAEVTG